MTAELRQFPINCRVTALVYGERKNGRVTGHRSLGVVWVRWDGALSDRWMHVDSLSAA